MNAFETMMATERVRNDYANALIRNAQLRPGPFELTASEQYILDKANEQLEITRQLYRRELIMRNQNDEKRISVPEGTEGQNDAWPGEGRATRESGTDKTEDTNSQPEGTRKPERVTIPVVR